MGHNRASSPVFRFRSYLTLIPSTIVAILCASFGFATDAPRMLSAGGAPVKTGIGVYEEMNSEPFAGKRIGLITNQTGVDSDGRRTIDVFAGRKDLKLVALFSPEHGISGNKDEAKIGDAVDSKTGVPIFSLYGEARRPSDDMLKGIDVLVFDIQDAGVRFYTYVTTMAYCMEAAAKHRIEFVVMDRPDPLGGEVIEGPMLDAERTSFTAYFPMPVRYGMTIGELAQMFNAENHIGADLRVIRMQGWHRDEDYDQTELKWIPPSPNLRTVNEAFLYPGIEMLQAGGVSVGRGTDTPFEVVGAPWVRGDELAADLNRRAISGVRFAPTKFTPNDGVFKGQACNGVKIAVTNRNTLRSIRVGLEIADALHRTYPDQFQLEKIITLLGSQATIDRIKHGDPAADIIASWANDLDKFRKMREKYLLYH
jgi:uncharacterized protein YbbC (DUF1343 family)